MLFSEEEVPPLKAWIVKRIENTSDADADVLADYVIALLRHDGDVASVRKLCEQEIPDFLTEDPQAFLDDVFQALAYKTYLPNAAQPPPPFLKGATRAAFDAPPAFGDQQVSPANPGSKKRTFHDRGELDAMDGRELYGGGGGGGGGGRVFKQARRGGGRRGGAHGDFPAMGFPAGMPPLDPAQAMEAMMQMQAMGMPLLGMGRGGWRGRGKAQLGGRGGRCRDFDTKGFCARGSTCPFDHGDQTIYYPMPGEDYDPNGASIMMMAGPQSYSDMSFGSGAANRGRKGGRKARAGRRGGGRAPFSAEGPVHDRSQSTIVVENIPEESFSEDEVRSFFSQFGTIVDVSMRPYKHLAVVKFDKWESADAAYRSPKVIFDNRFVKVFWYKDSGSQTQRGPRSANGSEMNGYKESHGDEAMPEVEMDLEEFHRKQEEAQKRHLERETKKLEVQQQLEELGKQQQDLLAKHREENERLQAKFAEKNGGAAGADANAGSGTDMLRAKLAALEQEAKILGIDPNAADDLGAPYSSSRGGYRGRGAPRGRGFAARGDRGGRHAAYAQYSLDNRPKKLSITGVDFTPSDKDELLRHFLLNLGEFESVETAPAVTHVSFPDRKAAEKFYFSLQGKELPGVEGKLELSWVSTPPPPRAPGSSKATALSSAARGAVPGSEDSGGVGEEQDNGQGDEEMGAASEEGEIDDTHAMPRQSKLVDMDYEVADEEAW